MKAPRGNAIRTGNGISRRCFLHNSTLAAVAFSVVPRNVIAGSGQISPNEKITLAGIGMGGQGIQNIENLMRLPGIQVVAVCDVNRESGGYLSWNWTQGNEIRTCGRDPARRAVETYYASKTSSGTYSGCKSYNDYRELLDKEDIDAVMVATPDHSHAVITIDALKRRKHVYCEKPLTYSVEEARLVTEAARQAKVATQLGNQGQATEQARLVCELVADGAMGAIREVHVWSGPRFWSFPTWDGRPKDTPPIPNGLDWDLWLGPAPHRPYHPCYCPWTWRNWWDFGTGLLGDLGCHKLSTVFKALNLGHPISVEASATKLNPETYPLGEIVRYEFPARGSMPPVTLVWYDGGLKPPRPAEMEPDEYIDDVIYIGEKGKIAGQDILPELKSYKRPAKTLPRSPGHFEEWVAACRGGAPAGSNFIDHSGLLTEVCLLGNVAVRAQKKLLWDGQKMQFKNDEKSNRLLRREYRAGWKLA